MEELKMKKWTKKTKKIVALSLVAIAVIGGGSAYAYSSSRSKQKLEVAQTEVKNQELTLKTLNGNLKGYFDKKSPSYLVENMQESQIKDLKKEVKKATSLKETTIKVDHSIFDKEVDAVNETMTKLETTFHQQQALNKLFTGTAVNGPKVSKDLSIADDLKQETINQVKKLVEKPTSDFEKTTQSLTTEAENQVKQLDTAKTAVSKVYKDNKVISVDSKLYDNAKNEVNKIKNAKAKKALADELTKVKSDIDKKAKEAEAQQKQEAQKVENEVTNTNQQAKTENENKQTVQETNNAENTVTNNQNDNSNSGSYVPQDNGSAQQQPAPPATGSENTGGQGITGGETPPPATGGGNSGGNSSTGGGSTAPQGYVGPFGSEAEADSYGRSNAVNGYQTMEMDGKWYVSVY